MLFAIFFGAALAVNYAGLNAPMTYDSRGLIEDSRKIFDAQGLNGAVAIFPQRPLPMITFYLNYLVGGMEPAWFRVVNLAILAVLGIIVFLVVDLILNLTPGTSGTSPTARRFIGVLLALLFVLHPLQTYVTLYIWQRTALMACLFYYAALAVYLAVRTGLFRRPAAGYVLCVAFFLCALLSKENSFTLPFVLVMAEIALFREKWRTVALSAVVFGLVFAACVGVSSTLQHPHGKEHLGTGILETVLLYYHESGVTLGEVILTQSRVLFRYVALILIPLPSSLLLTSPQVVSRSLLDPAETLPAFIGSVALILLSILIIRKRPVAGFGMLFFLVNLLPEALFVPQYSFFAYRAVLPMLGILLVIADIASVAAEKLVGRHDLRLVRAVLVGLAAASVLFVAGVTSIRATIWSDNIRFWREAVDNLPPLDGRVERLPAIQALNNLGVALMKKGSYLEAAQTYENVLKLEPTDPRKRVLLAAAYAELGKTSEAEALFKEALAMKPNHVPALAQYGTLLMALDRDSEAVEYLRKAAGLAPTDAAIKELLEKAKRGTFGSSR